MYMRWYFNFCCQRPGLCGTNTELRKLSGVITSPNFPSNFNADETCHWTIIAPSGYRVQFAIQFLGIEDHRYSRPGSCGDDSITISEHRGNITRDVKVLCGCSSLFSFVSFENEMFLRFNSYRKNNWPGFYATYKALGEFLVAFFVLEKNTIAIFPDCWERVLHDTCTCNSLHYGKLLKKKYSGNGYYLL